MYLRKKWVLFLLAVFATGVFVACDSGGTGTDPEPSPEPPTSADSGGVTFTLARTADSDLPSDVDSAFIRIWQPDGSFNLSDLVNVPDPSQQTEVSFEVPADTGYQAGVLAVAPEEFDPLDKKLRAHGSSGKFTVVSGDTSRVSLDPRSADLTLKRPESLAPNQKDTIEATYTINPPDVFISLDARQSSISSFDFFDGTDLDQVGFRPETDTTVSQEFEITGPNVDTEDTTFVKAQVFPNVNNDWLIPGRDDAPSFFPSENGPSFEIPVVPGSGDGDGTIIITFSRDGDGWTKTQRTVE